MSISGDQRAASAAYALDAYAIQKEGGDGHYDETAVILTDLLADLMHYARQTGIDFGHCLTRAADHFTEECDADGIPAAIRATGIQPPRQASPRASAPCTGVSVGPVYDDPENGITVPVPDAPHTATVWTVYRDLPGGGREPLIDCASEHSANVAASMVERALAVAGLGKGTGEGGAS